MHAEQVDGATARNQFSSGEYRPKRDTTRAPLAPGSGSVAPRSRSRMVTRQQ